MSAATLASTGPRPVLRFERHLRDSIDVVWKAVTDPVEMRSWFPTRIEIDEWKVGASLVHHFDEHDVGPLPGTVLEWDPPHRVSFTWDVDTITFELTPAPDGGTVFVLTEQLSATRAARNAACGAPPPVAPRRRALDAHGPAARHGAPGAGGCARNRSDDRGGNPREIRNDLTPRTLCAFLRQ